MWIKRFFIIEKELIPSKFNSPLIICGCHGGGTSFLAKILRHSGAFLGEDAGSMEARKLHESHSILRLNEKNIQRIVPSCPSGMRTTKKEYWDIFNKNVYSSNLIAPNFRRMRVNYWGTNTILHYLLKRSRIKVWGWKDPRNSLLLHYWLNYFPQAKIIVLKKKWEVGKKGKSGSGKWFKEDSTEEVRNIYMNPPYLKEIPSSRVRFIEFEKVVSDLQYFNNFMKWCELAPLNTERDFIDFWERLKLES